MATLYTDVATKELTPDPANMMTPQQAGAKVYEMTPTITLAAAQIADVIRIKRLKKGDMVLPTTSVWNAALGASTTLSFGDDDAAGADAARYKAATATSSAGVISFQDVALIAKVPYVVQNDCWLTATLAGGAATGAVKVFLQIARAGG
jgi:hypothetical protein